MSRLRALGVLLLVLFAFLGTTVEAATNGRRVALVIGNSDYQNWARLKNASGDAELIAKRLRAIGFKSSDVVEAIDVEKAELEKIVRDFYVQATGAELVLIYYTGHGAQVEGQGWIIPKDAAAPGSLNKSTVAWNAVAVSSLIDLAKIGQAGIVLIDACRENVGRPGASDGSKGGGRAGLNLTIDRSQVPRGVIVQMSTERNKVAYDGKGDHSLYAVALDKYLRQTDVEIRDLLGRVENEVFTQDSRQRPNIVENGLRGDMYLTLGLNPQPGGPSLAEREGERAKDDAAWSMAISMDSRQAYQAYIERNPRGFHLAEADEALKRFPAEPPPESPTEAAARLIAAIPESDWRSMAPEVLAQRMLAKTTGATIGDLSQAGDIRATVLLAALVDQGAGGFAQDRMKALELYQHAVEKGDHTAERVLGEFAQAGREGVARDNSEASRRYAAAAFAGDMVAQDRLGMMHAAGLLGVEKINDAVSYYQMAVDRGYGPAQCHLAAAYSEGRLGLSVDGLKAVAFAERSAKQENYCGLMLLASMHLKALHGMPRNDVQAAALYKKAADQGYPAAQTAMALLYEQALGVPRDPVAAGRYYKAAADQGFAPAQFRLGMGYLAGDYGLTADPTLAVNQFRAAAGQGHAGATAALGWAYSEGLGGLTADQDEALRLIRLAAAASDPDGQYRLGFMNAEGRGTTKNPAEAQRLMKLAAGQGYSPAIKWLEASSAP